MGNAFRHVMGFPPSLTKAERKALRKRRKREEAEIKARTIAENVVAATAAKELTEQRKKEQILSDLRAAEERRQLAKEAEILAEEAAYLHRIDELNRLNSILEEKRLLAAAKTRHQLEEAVKGEIEKVRSHEIASRKYLKALKDAASAASSSSSLEVSRLVEDFQCHEEYLNKYYANAMTNLRNKIGEDCFTAFLSAIIKSEKYDEKIVLLRHHHRDKVTEKQVHMKRRHHKKKVYIAANATQQLEIEPRKISKSPGGHVANPAYNPSLQDMLTAVSSQKLLNEQRDSELEKERSQSFPESR